MNKPRVSRTKGHLSKRTAFVREVVKEVAGYVTSPVARWKLLVVLVKSAWPTSRDPTRAYELC